jgi:hypothetical protein
LPSSHIRECSGEDIAGCAVSREPRNSTTEMLS